MAVRYRNLARQGFVTAIATGALVAGWQAAQASAAKGPIQLAPHRAVYEIVLDEARSGSGVTELSGRLVFEFTGSACEGYTQNMRFVLQTVGRDGNSTITDMRSSSWEDGKAGRYRFTTSNYRDQEQTDATTGNAERQQGSGEVKVELTKPSRDKLTLAKGVLFPVQHSRRLIDAARSDQRVLDAEVYDGSDKGKKVYSTTAMIGKSVEAPSVSVVAKVRNAERLAGLSSWPVAISYYESGKANEDALPVYEIGFRYFANGVSENLSIDYGEFAVKGVLKQLDFFEASKCDAEAKP
jgi:hypothetical protein